MLVSLGDMRCDALYQGFLERTGKYLFLMLQENLRALIHQRSDDSTAQITDLFIDVGYIIQASDDLLSHLSFEKSEQQLLGICG